jgi:hypothetical protein
MAENMMNSDHKATNQKFRDGWDATFSPKAKRYFEDLYPDSPIGKQHEFEGSIIVNLGQPALKPCLKCGYRTWWYDLMFEAPLCSIECNREIWAEYFKAERKVVHEM